MPLVRYEVQCEHTLANPELFRSAARDDPEGLLEGVAVAGLIGIVRQLGDLAEFAAEIFRDLHKELTSVGGRAHDLTVRVQQLETGLPAVEKTLLSEPNQLRFAYTNGADWHASIRSDQNHCTSGELPRFVRNFYEECRGPPRLFLLDKFDVAGSGACLKRYTDPSFFKLEWASSELLKAQRAQRDKKARREKKKGRRRKTGQAIAAINQIPARVRYGSASLDDLDSLSHLLASTLKDEVASSSSNQGINHGAGTQTQRRSNLGPRGKISGGSLPPSGPSAPQAGGGASKPLKLSAKDIEANVSGKFYQPSEPGSVAESMAGKISKIIEMEDRNAVPSVGLIPRNVDHKLILKDANGSRMPAIDVETKAINRVTKNDLEAAAMARTGRTSRGMSRSNVSMDDREGPRPGNSRTSQSSMPDVTSRSNASLDSPDAVNFANTRASEMSMSDVPSERDASLDAQAVVSSGDLMTTYSSFPDSIGHPGLQGNSSRIGSVDVRDSTQLSGDLSRSSVVAKDTHVAAAGLSKQDPGRYSRGGDGSANAPTSSTSEGLLVVESVKEQVHGTYETGDWHGDFHRSQGSPHSRKPSQYHAGKQRQSLLQSNTYASEDSPLSASGGESPFYDGHLQRLANNAGDVPSSLVATVYQQPDLPPIRIEEVPVYEEGSHMVSVSSAIVLSQCSSPIEDIRPTASMLSRLSYSSELVSVSSGSEPDSPVSPKSPAFNALYSPPELPSRTSEDMSESPPGIYMGSYSRSGHHSGLSSPRSEILVLSSSPKSPSTSTAPVPWTDEGDHAGPLRPPPPPPISNIVSENPSHFGSRDVANSARYQPYSLPFPSLNPSSDLSTSLETDGMPSQSKEGSSCVSSFEENAEKVHAEPSGRIPDNLDLLHDSTSSRDLGLHFEAPSSHIEGIQSPVADLKAEEHSGSTSLTPSVTESSRSSSASPFGLSDSATTQPSQLRFVHSDPQPIPELRTVDVPSNGATFNIDSASPLVEESKAGSFFEDRQGPSSNLAFTDFVRSSLILPPRPSDSPSSSAHTSPLGSPKQRFQRIFLTNPTLQPTPSPLGQAMSNGPSAFPVNDEESVPSSPTGSVIIKDTPSPPGSPASNYSESESEIHEFHPPEDQPKSPVSSYLVAHALEDVVIQGKPSSGEINVQEDPRFKSSQSRPTSVVSGPSNSASKELDHAAYSLPEDPAETPASFTPVHHDISHEETALHVSPPTSPLLNSGPTNPLHSTEVAALRPVSILSGLKSQNSSASNSPPESPPRKEYLPEDDRGLCLELRGRSKSDSTFKTGIKLPLGSPDRSPSNSPPTSPPKFSDQASSLRWRKRSGPASTKPDFSLPPNLVPRSETSSPPCSPPPQSDSPKQWDERSEVSSSSNSSDSSDLAQGNQNGAAGVYRLSDSPLPLDSPTMSEEGDRSSGSSSRSESDVEDNDAAGYEDGIVQSSTAELALEKPSHSSSDKPQFEVLSSVPRSSNDGYEPSEAQFSSSTFESSTGPVLSNSPSQEISIQQATLGNRRNLLSNPETFEPPPPPPAPGSADTPTTKDALAAAIAHHDWNMMKALTFKDPGHRPVPPPDERSILLEQMRTESFSLHRTDDSLGMAGHTTRPSANINVAAILEKANAIRQVILHLP
ncbi:hypothetical protein M758_8G195800 [Ceratodon purpureus]|nr:hypothetical protein M758_8G195800 [Ceratodon purpureus]KAG0609589.1 hypothetical protein M758_8G195800 [Ceratodon purpureus]